MPKNLKGGYQVIDLRNIDLTLTGEAQDITDVEVLEQLATLRDYIQPSHDYVKPLKKKLKPILVSIRDKKSDEEQESSIWANLSLYDDELSFKIEAVVNNNPLKVLQINVVFELVTEEDGSTHYEIDDAKVLLSELVKMGDINVEGITSKGIANTGALANIGDVDISGDLSASGDVSVGGDLDVTGDVTTGDLSLNSGKVAKIFENIVDKDGHKRFIEGNGTSIEQEGVTISYCKWSLSGSHLMVVLAGSVTNDTTLANSSVLASYNIPQWVYDKLVPVWSNALERKKVSMTATNWGTQECDVFLRKYDNKIDIVKVDNITLTDNRGFRIAFDFTIDNEEQE